jgi:hypothetical protein
MLQQQNAQVQQESAIVTKQAEAEIEAQIAQAKAMLMEKEYQLKSQLEAQLHQYKLEEIELQGQLKTNNTIVGNTTKQQGIVK